MMKSQGDLQLPLYQHFNIIKVHLALWLLQVECLHGIYITVLVQLRQSLLVIFGYCARAFLL